MINPATALGKSGLQDWVIQRVTALILGFYTLYLVIFFLGASQLQFSDWEGLFSSSAMRYFSLISLLSLIAHAWIGIWTIITDYIKNLVLSFWLQVLLILILIGYFFWGFAILWKVKI